MNKIILDDCLNYLKSVDDNSIDIVVTDPPYMITDIHFDKTGFDISAFLQEIKRILKPNSYFISFGSIELLAKFSEVFPIRWTGGWIKPNATMRTATAKKPMSKLELFAVYTHPDFKIKNLVFNKIKTYGHANYKKTQRNSGYKRDGKDSISRANTSGFTIDGYISENTDGSRFQTDIFYAPNKPCMKHSERTDHPTQKPIELIQPLIEMHSKVNDLVLDPFAGSGTTALACIKSNRNYLCIEKDPYYFDIMNFRINNSM